MKILWDKTKAASAMQASLMGETGPCLSGSELIRYIEGVMEKDERLRVDRHLVSCPLCEDAIEGAENISPRKRRAILAKVQPGQAPRRPLPLVFSRPVMTTVLLAASVLITIGVWQNTSDPGRPDLFAAYFQPYPNSIPLVRSSSAPTPMEEAMQAYELSDYVRAEALLAGVLKAEPANEPALFYHSICLLTQNRPDEAIRNLDLLAKSPPWREAARWYQAMGYLSSGETKAARELLEPIAAATGFFAAKATALVRELK